VAEPKPSIILDTGALIAVENKKRKITDALRAAWKADYQILIPNVVYAEWSVGADQGLGKRIEGIAEIVGENREVAKQAGLALRKLGLDGKEHLADSIVAACAKFYGGILYTSDPLDMQRLFAVLEGKRAEIERV